MVAGVAQLCSLNIGQNLKVNLEDTDFNLEDIKRVEGDVHESLTSAIQKRNEELSESWGWKYPRAAVYLDKIKEHLISPYLILVSRDPAAIASRPIARGKPVIDTIKLILNLHKKNIDLVQRWEVPTLLVSYERALRNPERFIEMLCLFIGAKKPSNINSIVSYMKPGKYKNISDFEIYRNETNHLG